MDGKTIKEHLDAYMRKCNLTEIDAVTAGAILDRDGLLNDSASRPGKPLRDLLRAGKIKGAYQLPNHRWVIPLGSKSDIVEKPSEVISNNIHLEDKRNIGIKRPMTEIEKNLITDGFTSVHSLNEDELKDAPGLYCIKLRKGAVFGKDFGPIRQDGIIYIGQASRSIRERLFEEELNCFRPATFFRSIGAMLGYLPPKGSLAGKNTRNYKFSSTDELKIRNWMRQSLMVNFVYLEATELDEAESYLIKKYTPLVNIQGNPNASNEIKLARDKCVRYAKGLTFEE